MEEVKESGKLLSLNEIMILIRSKIIWILIIIFACLGCGVLFVALKQKTTYTAVSSVCVQAKYYIDKEDEFGNPMVDSEGNIIREEANVAEHTLYQYSALIAPEYEKVLKSNEIAKAVAKENININVGAISFSYTEKSAFFTIKYSYSQHGGDADKIKADMASALNAYIDVSIKTINDPNSAFPEYLKEKLLVYSIADKNNVATSNGYLKTIILALMAGILVSAIFIMILFLANDTVSSKEVVERLTNVPNLALIDISSNQLISNEEYSAKKVSMVEGNLDNEGGN